MRSLKASNQVEIDNSAGSLLSFSIFFEEGFFQNIIDKLIRMLIVNNYLYSFN